LYLSAVEQSSILLLFNYRH